jgi:hypothetical protein
VGQVRTVGIDPGKPPKTVFATNICGRGTWGTWLRFRAPISGLITLAIAEKPAGVIRQGRTPASVVSPAGWGMAALFSVQLAPDGMRVWIPMEEWKNKLIPNGARMKKEAFCANLVQMFKLEGLDPEKDADQDEIDAVGIAEAGLRFTWKELRKWAVHW